LKPAERDSKTKLTATIVIFVALALMLLLPNIAMEEYVDPDVLEAFDAYLMEDVWEYMEKPANKTWIVLSTYIERHIGDVIFTLQDDNGTLIQTFWWKERSGGWEWGVGAENAPVDGLNVTIDRYTAYMLYREYDEHLNETFHHLDREVSDHISRVGDLFDVFDRLVGRNHISSPPQFDTFVHNTHNDFNSVRLMLAGEYYYNFNYFLDDPDSRSVDLGIWGSYSI